MSREVVISAFAGAKVCKKNKGYFIKRDIVKVYKLASSIHVFVHEYILACTCMGKWYLDVIEFQKSQQSASFMFTHNL